MVAGFNNAQNQGFSNASQMSAAGQPYANQAGSLIAGSANPTISQLPSATQSLMSPYLQTAVGNTAAQLQNINQQQQQQLTGQAIGAGAYGGDRAGVAAAELANQQSLAAGQTLGTMENQGYQSAQGAALNSLEANAQMQGQAGTELGALGNQNLNNLLTTGGMQQQLSQEQLNIPYEQFQQQQAYPFQTTGWLGNLAEGLGSQMGGTSNTITSGPNPISQVAGLGAAGLGAAGAAGAFAARGGHIRGLASGGSSGEGNLDSKIRQLLASGVLDANYDSTGGVGTANAGHTMPGNAPAQGAQATPAGTDPASLAGLAKGIADVTKSSSSTPTFSGYDANGNPVDASGNYVALSDGSVPAVAGDNWDIAARQGGRIHRVSGGSTSVPGSSSAPVTVKGVMNPDVSVSGNLGLGAPSSKSTSSSMPTSGSIGGSPGSPSNSSNPSSFGNLMSIGKDGKSLYDMGSKFMSGDSLPGVTDASQYAANMAQEGSAFGDTASAVDTAAAAATADAAAAAATDATVMEIAAVAAINRGGRVQSRRHRDSGGSLVGGADPSLLDPNGTGLAQLHPTAARTIVENPADQFSYYPGVQAMSSRPFRDLLGVSQIQYPVASPSVSTPIPPGSYNDGSFSGGSAKEGGRIRERHATTGSVGAPMADPLVSSASSPNAAQVQQAQAQPAIMSQQQYSQLPLNSLQALSSSVPPGSAEWTQINEAMRAKADSANPGAQSGGLLPGSSMGRMSSFGGSVSPMSAGVGYAGGGLVPRYDDGGSVDDPPDPLDAASTPATRHRMNLPNVNDVPQPDRITSLARQIHRTLTDPQDIVDPSGGGASSNPLPPDSPTPPPGPRGPFLTGRAPDMSPATRGLLADRDVDQGQRPYTISPDGQLVYDIPDRAPGKYAEEKYRVDPASGVMIPLEPEEIDERRYGPVAARTPPGQLPPPAAWGDDRAANKFGIAAPSGFGDESPLDALPPKGLAAPVRVAEEQQGPPAPPPKPGQPATPVAPPVGAAATRAGLGAGRPTPVPSGSSPALRPVASATPPATTAGSLAAPPPPAQAAAASSPSDNRYKDLMASLAYKPTPYEKPKHDSQQALWGALMSAGFGMAASRSPSALSALGEGGLHGFGTFAASQRQNLTDDQAAAKLHGETEKWNKDFASKQQTLVRQTAADDAKEKYQNRREDVAQIREDERRRDDIAHRENDARRTEASIANAAGRNDRETVQWLPQQVPDPDNPGQMKTVYGAFGNRGTITPTDVAFAPKSGGAKTGSTHELAQWLISDREKQRISDPNLPPLTAEQATALAQNHGGKATEQQLRLEGLAKSESDLELKDGMPGADRIASLEKWRAHYGLAPRGAGAVAAEPAQRGPLGTSVNPKVAATQKDIDDAPAGTFFKVPISKEHPSGVAQKP